MTDQTTSQEIRHAARRMTQETQNPALVATAELIDWIADLRETSPNWAPATVDLALNVARAYLGTTEQVTA